MTVWSAILIGLVQGATGFFPISASAHRCILQNFLRIGTQGHPFFDFFLQLGMIAALVLAFWTDLQTLSRQALLALHVIPSPRGKRQNALLSRLLSFLLIAALPLLPALLVHNTAQSLFENTFFVGFALLATGGVLFWAERSGHGNKDVKSATMRDVLLVGFAQALGVFPGISHSAWSISCALLRGFDRNFALRFGMLLSLPALLGVNLLTLIDAVQSGMEWHNLPFDLLLFVCSALSGFLAIYFLRRILQRCKLGFFSFYCWGAGLVTLLLSLVA